MAADDARLREAITEFAWGTAHDFSNYLQIMMGFSEFLQMQHASDPELAQGLSEILTAGNRAKGFVGQLLVLAKRREFTLQPGDLNAVVRGAEPALREQLGGQVALELRLAGEPLEFALDAPGIALALSSLAGQAKDAMSKGGTLTIETARAARNGAPGVRLSVRDTGAPIRAEWLPRIAEPYFMKRHGRGRGLEFAVAYALMEEYGGAVEIETGDRAAVHLHFPRGG
jgi:two-component system, cell cycle sensor histidine kinase and response regulator CckA